MIEKIKITDVSIIGDIKDKLPAVTNEAKGFAIPSQKQRIEGILINMYSNRTLILKTNILISGDNYVFFKIVGICSNGIIYNSDYFFLSVNSGNSIKLQKRGDSPEAVRAFYYEDRYHIIITVPSPYGNYLFTPLSNHTYEKTSLTEIPPAATRIIDVT